MRDKATIQKRESIAAFQAQISRSREYIQQPKAKHASGETKLQHKMNQDKSMPDFVGVAG